MNATINLENKHFPVLLNELISIISPLYGGTFLDCTFGQGGYSEKILNYSNTKIIALDRDENSKIVSKEFKKKSAKSKQKTCSRVTKGRLSAGPSYSYLKLGSVPVMYLAATILQSSAMRFE